MSRSGTTVRAAFAALALAAGVSVRGTPAARAEDPAPVRPNAVLANVLLVSVDALRADHVGFLGGRRATTPRLDALAARAVVFEDAWSASSWTPPAVSSFLTGLHPIRHGNVGGPVRLPDEVETLAETLRSAGWRTRAAVQNAWFAKEFGLAQGFDRYESWNFLGDPLTEEAKGRDLAAWMAEDAERPFLLWVHHFSPHCPYVPREPWISRFSPPKWSRWAASVEFEEMHAFKFRMLLPPDLARFEALYDSEIAFTDEHIGRLLDAVPAGRPTVVVLVADHGEEFKDHGGLGHYRHLHREVARVPFLIALPGQEAGVRPAGPVSATDLVPTLRAVLGLPAAKGLDGVVLLHPMVTTATPPPATIKKNRPGLIVGDAARSSLGTFAVLRASDTVFSFKYAQSYDAGAAAATLAGGGAADHGAEDDCGAPAADAFVHSFAVRDERWTLLCDTPERDMEACRMLRDAAPGEARPEFRPVGLSYRFRLYDRVADPDETIDLAAKRPDEARRLAALLRDEFRRAPNRLPAPPAAGAKPFEIPADVARELRALGYVK